MSGGAVHMQRRFFDGTDAGGAHMPMEKTTQ